MASYFWNDTCADDRSLVLGPATDQILEADYWPSPERAANAQAQHKSAQTGDQRLLSLDAQRG
jgi:hypothetical protein